MKAMASDLDGTLVFNDTIKQEDIEAIHNFRRNGNLFGICSGRVLNGILVSTQKHFDCDFYIASSGSLICDGQGNTLYKEVIPFDTIVRLYEDFKDLSEVFFQANNQYYNIGTAIYHDTPVIQDVYELKDYDHTGISFECESEELASKLAKEMSEKYPDLTFHQNINALDITVKGCSKGKALLKVKELFGIDLIAGIGDSYNDIPMLKEADLSFTFHCSNEIVKQEANYYVNHEYEALKLLEDYHV